MSSSKINELNPIKCKTPKNIVSFSLINKFDIIDIINPYKNTCLLFFFIFIFSVIYTNT
jgi:hypothetical protein